MPGIPYSGTPQAEAFWISFWAALCSGLIYSLVTGFIVSLGVWFVQSRIERKRVRLQFEREIVLLRNALEGVVIKPDVLSIDNAVESEPPAAKGVISLIKQIPIDLWLENSGKWKAFLYLLRRTDKSHSKFIQAAKH
jgi:hypothetical protein